MTTTELRAKLRAVPTGGLFFRLLTRYASKLRRHEGASAVTRCFEGRGRATLRGYFSSNLIAAELMQ